MSSGRRAYQRLLRHSPIEIAGLDPCGLQFAERAHVEDVSDRGCRFTMRTAVQQGGIVGVEPLGPEGETLADDCPRMFVIIWVKPIGNRFTVSARCVPEADMTDVRQNSKLSY